MYNFELMGNEKLIKIFDDLLIKQNKISKFTTLILTDKRLLFLKYVNDYRENLRIGKGVDYIKYKEVYYQINLIDIKDIVHDKYYKVVMQDETIFEFNNNNLYKLIKSLIQNN